MADDAPTLPAIPTSTIEEALLHFRRPFTPAAVKWKIQVTGPKSKKEKEWATIVGYIDARLVAERLNAVVAGGWEEKAGEKVAENLLRYGLTVLGQTHTDVGEGQGQNTGMKVKATDSDALKRVAVRFGIAAYLYAMPAFQFYVTPKGDMRDDKPTIKRNSNGSAGYLKDAHEAWLRDAYEQWLKDEGEARFGEPLDHGDAARGSVGVLLEAGGIPEAEAGEEDLRPDPLDDDDAKRLRAEIEEVYGGLCKVNPDRLAQGRVDKMVEEAAHSHQELERVRDTLVNLELTEGELSGLRDQLIEKIGVKAAKPLIDSAERRGSQEERIASMKKAIEATDQAEPDGK